MRYRAYNPFLSCMGGLCGWEEDTFSLSGPPASVYSDAVFLKNTLSDILAPVPTLPPHPANLETLKNERLNLASQMISPKNDFDSIIIAIQEALQAEDDASTGDTPFMKWSSYLRTVKLNDSIHAMPWEEWLKLAQWATSRVPNGREYTGALNMLSDVIKAQKEKLAKYDVAIQDMKNRIEEHQLKIEEQEIKEAAQIEAAEAAKIKAAEAAEIARIAALKNLPQAKFIQPQQQLLTLQQPMATLLPQPKTSYFMTDIVKYQKEKETQGPPKRFYDEPLKKSIERPDVITELPRQLPLPAEFKNDRDFISNIKYLVDLVTKTHFCFFDPSSGKILPKPTSIGCAKAWSDFHYGNPTAPDGGYYVPEDYHHAVLESLRPYIKFPKSDAALVQQPPPAITTTTTPPPHPPASSNTIWIIAGVAVLGLAIGGYILLSKKQK